MQWQGMWLENQWWGKKINALSQMDHNIDAIPVSWLKISCSINRMWFLREILQIQFAFGLFSKK